MRSFDEPTSMRADERLSEIASIFAAGILRLHARQLLAAETAEKPASDSSHPRLEVPPKTVLTVHPG